MEKYTVKINTLNGLLPQSMPFVVSQVSEAIKLCCVAEREDIVERNLDIAIAVAEQVNKYSQGDLLYNYTPILLALLKDVDAPLDKFDTINHDIPMGLSIVKQFLSTYDKKVKTAAGEIIDFKANDNACMVVMANLLTDIKEGKNVLPIAYIITNLNFSRVQFVNGTFKFYCDILSEIGKAEF